ncbi:MAG: hypothetical protein K2Q26_06175 [Bdellovibrionales bacterium]|nr:hypothetical protein [Bdellovibrionales bacterium]
MFLKISSKALLTGVAVCTSAVVLISFQNCGKTQFAKNTADQVSGLSVDDDSDGYGPIPNSQDDPSEEGGSTNGNQSNTGNGLGTPIRCRFNNIFYSVGQQVTAFQNSSGATCVSQQRTCMSNGMFNGSYSHAICQVNAVQSNSCLFNGTSIPHGGKAPTNNPTCPSEQVMCSNGSTSIINGCAAVVAKKSCSFRDSQGMTIILNHGASINLFSSSSVSAGQMCQSQTRVCNDGVVSGCCKNQRRWSAPQIRTLALIAQARPH